MTDTEIQEAQWWASTLFRDNAPNTAAVFARGGGLQNPLVATCRSEAIARAIVKAHNKGVANE